MLFPEMARKFLIGISPGPHSHGLPLVRVKIVSDRLAGVKLEMEIG